MWGLSVRKQETWLPWAKRRAKFPMTSMPQSSMASAPATLPGPDKANAGKTLNPLSERI